MRFVRQVAHSAEASVPDVDVGLLLGWAFFCMPDPRGHLGFEALPHLFGPAARIDGRHLGDDFIRDGHIGPGVDAVLGCA